MEICTIGGFNEVGKNMTAVKVKEDVFIFDLGLHIPGVVELQEENVLEYTNRLQKGGHTQEYTETKLREFGAIPDDRVLDKLGWRNKVRAIFISHAHLDHVGAVPHLANRYPQATIFGTPFTMKVLEAILEDDKLKIKNRLKMVNPGSTHMIKGKSGTYKVDFVHTTHSTIHCVFPVLHTQEGIFFYALDLKFDNYPTLGKPPNYTKFKDIGKKIGLPSLPMVIPVLWPTKVIIHYGKPIIFDSSSAKDEEITKNVQIVKNQIKKTKNHF